MIQSHWTTRWSLKYAPHTFTSYAFGYAFASASTIPIPPIRSGANITSSVKSFLPLFCPQKCFLGGPPTVPCSYHFYSTYYIAFKQVGYMSVLHVTGCSRGRRPCLMHFGNLLGSQHNACYMVGTQDLFA